MVCTAPTLPTTCSQLSSAQHIPCQVHLINVASVSPPKNTGKRAMLFSLTDKEAEAGMSDFLS